MIIEILTIGYFIALIIYWYLMGYVFGSEGDYIFSMFFFFIVSIILFLVKVAIAGLDLSVIPSSSEWAIIILAVMAICGIPFVIGYISGSDYFHDDIRDFFKKLVCKKELKK